ncbi:MAG: type IX secretion system membrane protein PorP/SprF [Bacteroidia bacterium]
MKKLISSVLFCLLVCTAFAQYNPLQSQYVLNRIVINPAYAGSEGFLSTTFSYRKQWLGFDGAPETYSFTANTPLKNKHYNIGLLASQDNLAVLHQSQLGLIYAYRIINGKFSFSAGFQPGIKFLRNSWDEIKTTTQGDAAYQSAETSVSFDMGYGLYLQSKRFFFGFSSSAKLYQKVKSVNGDQPIFLVNTGYTFGDPKKASITVSALGRYMVKSYYQADINVMATFRDRISFGASYRYTDAIVGILQMKINDQLLIGYSYDYTLSHLSTYSSGTHELLLRYDFSFHVNAKSPRVP